MKLKKKQETKKQKNESEEQAIEIIMGTDSNTDFKLEISDVGDYMNDLKPKNHEKNKKQIVIPKSKNKGQK